MGPYMKSNRTAAQQYMETLGMQSKTDENFLKIEWLLYPLSLQTDFLPHSIMTIANRKYSIRIKENLTSIHTH